VRKRSLYPPRLFCGNNWRRREVVQALIKYEKSENPLAEYKYDDFLRCRATFSINIVGDDVTIFSRSAVQINAFFDPDSALTHYFMAVDDRYKQECIQKREAEISQGSRKLPFN